MISSNRQARVLWTSVLSNKKFYILAALLTVTGFVLMPTLRSLHYKWVQWDGAYSHGYLLVIVCFGMVFSRLSPLTAEKVHWPYTFFLFVPIALWSLGYATQVLVISQLSLPIFISCLILPWFGFNGLRAVAAPLALMFLAIPVWEVILPVLRNLTTLVASSGVRLLGIPAYIDGYSFRLPYGTVVIAGSCAGLSYFLMALTLASLNALYRNFALKQALLSTLLLVALSIIGNWLRVYSLILIAYYSKMQNPLVADHGQFGWWIFAGLFIIYLFCIRAFPERPIITAVRSERSGKHYFGATLLTVAFSILITTAVPLWLQKGSSADLTKIHPVMSARLHPVAPGQTFQQLGIDISGYDLAEIFRSQQGELKIFVGRLIFLNQQQGKELISDSQKVTQQPSEMLKPISSSYGLVNAEIVYLGRDTRLILWQYMLGRAHAATPIRGKWLQFLELLRGRSAAALWLAAVECQNRQCRQEYDQLNNAATIDSLITPMQLYSSVEGE